jgi:pimeloyl-ACP methyl ester carboxylesterase
MRLDHPDVSEQVFHPRPTTLRPTLLVGVGGARLACYVHDHDPDAGTVLHFHGNGELAAEYSAGYAPLFRRLGVNVCFAEYRGYGLSTGRPALVAMLPDGERVVEALGVPPHRLVAFGRSLGSLYAAELARRLPDLAGVVLDSGVADVLESRPLEDVADEPGIVEEVGRYFDQRAKLAPYRGRMLVLHAAQDHLLPAPQAERLHAWAGGADKRLVLFPEGDHNTILRANLARYVRELGDLLRGAVVAVGGPG